MTNVVRPLPEHLQRILDERVVFVVEMGRSLVEDEDSGIGQQRARDGDTLPLASRQPHAALTDDRVVPVLEASDELVAVGPAPGFKNGGTIRSSRSVGDGIGHRAIKKHVVLQHGAEERSEIGKPDGRHVLAIDEQPPRRGTMKAHDQADQRAFSCAARTDQRNGRAGSDAQRHVPQYGVPATYSKLTFWNSTSPRRDGSGSRSSSPASSVSHPRTSRRRSSAATASPSWVPTEAS